MKIALTILFILIAGMANAGEFTFEKNGMAYSMPMPPERWFKQPLLAPVVVIKESTEYVARFCSGIVGKFEDMGCAQIAPGYYCGITINQSMPAPLYDAVLHHETAHCHGWPADHPVE